MGAVSVSVNSATGQGVRGSKRAVTATIGFTGTYATNGDTIPIAALGLKSVDDMVVEGGRSGTVNGGISLRLAGTPGVPLLKVYDAQATEVPNATNITTRTAVVTFLGT